MDFSRIFYFFENDNNTAEYEHETENSAQNILRKILSHSASDDNPGKSRYRTDQYPAKVDFYMIFQLNQKRRCCTHEKKDQILCLSRALCCTENECQIYDKETAASCSAAREYSNSEHYRKGNRILYNHRNTPLFTTIEIPEYIVIIANTIFSHDARILSLISPPSIPPEIAGIASGTISAIVPDDPP